MKDLDLPEALKDLFFGKKQHAVGCDHLLSSRMEDGKYFCPSCGAISTAPLNPGRRL